MKKSIQDKIDQIKALAKGTPNQQYTLKSGNQDSLSKVIKTKEQADFFMKLLRDA